MNVVIYGPPGCGKTTYANEIREDGDIVFDLDAIAATLNPEYANYDMRPQNVADLLLAFRDVLVFKYKHKMLQGRRLIVIVTKYELAQSVSRQLKAELIRPR